MSQQNPEADELDEETRASEEVDDGIVDIYEDVPQFDTAPWSNVDINNVQDDDAEGDS